jgi:hypothetical protein
LPLRDRPGSDGAGAPVDAGPSTTRATAARSGRDDGMRGGDLRSGRDDGEVGEWAGLGSLRQVVGEVQSSCLGQRSQIFWRRGGGRGLVPFLNHG